MPDRTSSDWPSRLERGIAERALPGEARSGDHAVFVARSSGALVAAIDGLGHGGEAADAADVAAGVIARFPDEDPRELLERCHGALRYTRGVVMTVAWFDLERSTLSWAGVGNVDARLVRSGPDPREDVALVFGGVLGYRMPNVRPASMPLERGDLLVMITDGIESAISPGLAGGGAAQTMADRIFAMHGKGTDDALVVVVRYR